MEIEFAEENEISPTSTSVSVYEDEEDENIRSKVFSELKPYCINLLALLQSPIKNKKKTAVEISQFYQFLRRAPSYALQPFLEYAIFPLLLLLEAAIGSRSPQKVDSEGKPGIPNLSNMPNEVSDNVAEGVLLCVEELLRKCQLGSVNQMVLVLKNLTYGALLSPNDASEEFREGIVRCFKALLLGLHRCSVKSCMCKQIHGLPALMEGKDSHTQYNSKHIPDSAECLLAFFQSQNASAAVGHWLSLLLKIADIEASRGHRGSSRLRVEAFLTLRVLVAKVGTADALAFFLPGVVSGFAKVLRISKTMISGAAGSTEAINQATRGLVEFLMIVLQDKANLSGLDMPLKGHTGSIFREAKSGRSFIEAMRRLPHNHQIQAETLQADPSNHAVVSDGDLYVNRTNHWISETSAHVDKLLSAVFPHLCVHPVKKVRQGLVDSIQGLLSECHYTLKRSRSMMLECLCVLVCDESDEVCLVAQRFLETFFTAGNKHLIEGEIAEIFNRLLEKIPKVVFGSDETDSVAYAQRLLSIMYFSGPQLLVDILLRSPITVSRFIEVLMLCLDQNSVFTGSLDKFISERPLPAGYLHSIAELRSASRISCADKNLQMPVDSVHQDYEVPKMPPWFVYVGSQKLYQVLAGILRLAGLSLMADSRRDVSLSVITEIPLEYLRKLISEVRMKQYGKESWNSWYRRIGSGQLVRQASTAACILNEIVYGISDKSIDGFVKMFRSSRFKGEEVHSHGVACPDEPHPRIAIPNESSWEVCSGLEARGHLIDCVGSIVHEYLSPEMWDIPIDSKVSVSNADSKAEDITLHLFHDATMLHQVIIDGIGTFNVCLGKDFLSSGFLHSSLYLLLENLICSSSEIRRASDAVLHVISASSGYPTVSSLVISNADYIIDSLCRELRHMDLDSHVPNVIAAMLSYVGVANEILPLLEEPMRSVSLELEVLGRHQHPNLTVPFLKGVAEIIKASKSEACAMPTQAVLCATHVRSNVSTLEKMTRNRYENGLASHHGGDSNGNSTDTEDMDTSCSGSDMRIEPWEELLFKLNDSRRYRRIVGSIAGSCLVAATPLLASLNESACLVSLDIIEDGITALAKVEEAYKHEKETKQEIQRAIHLCSFHDLEEDSLDAPDETDENRLLPAMNKIWPALVNCIKNKNPLAVRRCLSVVSTTVQICGGDFFSRRFHTDGNHFFKLLTTSPFTKKPIFHTENPPLQLPYRTTTLASSSLAESSSLKVQISALNMIAELAKNKRSSSALEIVLKKVSGLVVGIACSNVVGLHEAAFKALSGLACIEPDLIWVLLADVYYSLKKVAAPLPPVKGLPGVVELLPEVVGEKEFLFVQYGGESFGFGIDVSAVEKVFLKMEKDVL